MCSISVISPETVQKMKFSIKHVFSKCDQIRSFLWIWSHLLKKTLMKNLIFCAVSWQHFKYTSEEYYSNCVSQNFNWLKMLTYLGHWIAKQTVLTYKNLVQLKRSKIYKCGKNLSLSWRRSLSYRNQSIDLLCRSMD